MTAGPLQGGEAKQVVVAGLRTAISRGEVSPGQRLIEAELTEMYGVTRGSVRAAMEDLAGEGLIERIPNRGARVRVVSVDEAIAILECRGVLEGLIASRAAQRIDDDQVKALLQIGEDMKRAVTDGELMIYSGLNHQLHAAIAEISGQQTASDLIVRLRSQIVRHQFQLSLRPGRPQVSMGQHLRIIKAVTSRRPEEAERAARAHVDSVMSALLAGTSP